MDKWIADSCGWRGTLPLTHNINMYEHILAHLPNKSSFRFVDHISHIDENGVIGDFTLRENAFFYVDNYFFLNPHYRQTF